MSARRYTVSCTIGPLDDREVDILADILWDHGAGRITFAPLPEKKRCVDCGRTYINWGAHAERCTGRPVGPRERVRRRWA